VLDHENGIRALGNGSAGHDFPDLAGLQGGRGHFSGADMAGKKEKLVGAGLRCAAGEAVACGAGKWRLIAVGADAFGQNPACGGSQRDGFCCSARRWISAGLGECFYKEVNLLRGLGIAQQR